MIDRDERKTFLQERERERENCAARVSDAANSGRRLNDSWPPYPPISPVFSVFGGTHCREPLRFGLQAVQHPQHP